MKCAASREGFISFHLMHGIKFHNDRRSLFHSRGIFHSEYSVIADETSHIALLKISRLVTRAIRESPLRDAPNLPQGRLSAARRQSRCKTEVSSRNKLPCPTAQKAAQQCCAAFVIQLHSRSAYTTRTMQRTVTSPTVRERTAAPWLMPCISPDSDTVRMLLSLLAHVMGG